MIVTPAEVFAYLGKGASATEAERSLLTVLQPLAEDALKKFVGFSVESGTYTHFLPDHDSFDVEPDRLDVVNERVVIGGETDSHTIFLPERPVRSITNLYQDHAAYAGQGANDFAAASELTAGTDFYLDLKESGISWTGRVRKIAGTWPARARTVKVVYTAGLTAAELDGGTVKGPHGGSVRDLKYAALLTVAAAFIEATKHHQNVTGGVGAVKSERLADYAVTYADSVSRIFGMEIDLPPKAKDLAQPFKRFAL